MGERGERGGVAGQAVECLDRLPRKPGRQRAGFGCGHDIEAGEFGLRVGLSLVGVEQVIDDLEGEAESVRERGELVESRFVRACGDGAQAGGGAEEVGGLVLEDVVDDLARRSGGEKDVLDLATDDAGRACG